MRIISLDIGIKTCGFAITDKDKIISNPLENFSYSKNDKIQIVKRLEYWINEYYNEIDTILVGYPLDVNSFKTHTTLYIEDVLKMIKEKFNNFKIEIFDERYSTKEANELMMQYELKASLRKKMKDKIAATIILENFLNKSKNK